jgi:integrase
MARRAQPHPFHPTVTRWLDGADRRVKSGTPGARKVQERLDTYVADLPRAGGGRPERVALGTDDEGKAWVRLGELLEERRRAAEGLADPTLAHARRPILEHFEEWLGSLRSRQVTAGHVQLAGARARKLIERAGWKRLADVTLSSAEKALGAIQKEPARNQRAVAGKGRSAQTRNGYRSALCQFLRWCVRDGRLLRNAVEALESLDVSADRRHRRRCPEDGEVARLFAHLAGPTARRRSHMPPATRALAYRLAMATGLRADEVRSLAVGDFDLSAPAVTLPAPADKRRREAVLPLPAWLVDDLRPFLVGQLREACPWGHFPALGMGRILQYDLEQAGVAYEVDGQFWDMHSFRVWYITNLAGQPGIDPRTLLELARHSDPSLTLNTYARARPEKARAAVEALPVPGSAGRSKGRSVAAHDGTRWWTDDHGNGWGEGLWDVAGNRAQAGK